jgi:LacI family transcriptional regulator
MTGEVDVRSRPTMRDVAALAGVSFKTVSRVVNDEPGVSLELTARVHRAAEQLDYRHNLAASNLRRGQRTMAVGVLIQDVGNDFSATLLRAIEDRARTRGIAVFAASLNEEEQRERDVIADLVNRRVDGLVLMPATHDQGYLQNDLRAGLAVVVVDRPARQLDVDTVLVDNVEGGRTATRHLLRQGHQRIAFVGDREGIATADDRYVGYVRALEEAGLQVSPEVVRRDARSGEDAAVAVTDLFQQSDAPTALFAARNAAAIGAVRALRDLRQEHRVALVAFDDFPLSDLINPATTVIRQDAQAIGHTAADLLLRRLDGDTSPTRRVILPTMLVTRGSGEIPPGRRPAARRRPSGRLSDLPA